MVNEQKINSFLSKIEKQHGLGQPWIRFDGPNGITGDFRGVKVKRDPEDGNKVIIVLTEGGKQVSDYMQPKESRELNAKTRKAIVNWIKNEP